MDEQPKQVFRPPVDDTQVPSIFILSCLNFVSQMSQLFKKTFILPVTYSWFSICILKDLFSGSQTSASQDEFPDDSPKSPIEEVLAPSLLAMNLKLGSAPPDDV